MKVLEIKKEDLKYNIDVVKTILVNNSSEKEVTIIAVVKSNGMGLDLIEYSNFLIENGITYLAVATTDEAVALRNAKIDTNILMMSPVVDENELQLLIENDITLTVGNLDELELIKVFSSKLQKKVTVQIKVDTGFARYGFLYTDKENILKAYETNENISITGIFTHFSKAIDEKWTNTQFNRFTEVIEYLENNNINVGIKHCASSTAFLKYPNMYLDAVRLGSVFQGRVLESKNKFRKIGTFKTNIVEIKELPKGYNISYGKTYKTKKETRIAIVPVGYGDGLNRNKLRDDFSFKNNILSILHEIKLLFKKNNLKVKINNKTFNIIGRLGMYHAIVDITGNDNIKAGDEVILDASPLQTSKKIRREYL